MQIIIIYWSQVSTYICLRLGKGVVVNFAISQKLIWLKNWSVKSTDKRIYTFNCISYDDDVDKRSNSIKQNDRNIDVENILLMEKCSVKQKHFTKLFVEKYMYYMQQHTKKDFSNKFVKSTILWTVIVNFVRVLLFVRSFKFTQYKLPTEMTKGTLRNCLLVFCL